MCVCVCCDENEYTINRQTLDTVEARHWGGGWRWPVVVVIVVAKPAALPAVGGHVELIAGAFPSTSPTAAIVIQIAAPACIEGDGGVRSEEVRKGRRA